MQNATTVVQFVLGLKYKNPISCHQHNYDPLPSMKQPLIWNCDELFASPLFEPLHPIVRNIRKDEFPSLDECNALVAAHHFPITVQSGLPLRFVTQEVGKLAFELQYEPRCYLKAEVQTREHNWHDLLNALVWLTFPKTKAAINARHYKALTEGQDTIENQRGAVRDMNTLFDESGVVVVCSQPELSSLLQEFRWKELFWERREQVQTCMAFYLFGHGLYEKALHPYVGLTGQGLLLSVEKEFFACPLNQKLERLDGLVADYLNAPAHCLSTRELTPVPLLGVPGWATDNERADYYDDIRYFRPGRRSKV